MVLALNQDYKLVFFAMKMQREMEVPVGVIDCYWGGTSILSWMSEEGLRRTGKGSRALLEYAEKTAGISREESIAKEKVFWNTLNAWSGRVDAYRAAHPGCSWEEVEQAEGACPWDPPAGPASPFRSAGLYATMVEPLTPAALSGILYYQGETDATGPECEYDAMMMALIDLWRSAFREESLPFLFVQLPMWIEKGAADSKTWPELRRCQSLVRDRMRNTGMICLLDQGEYGNLHPANKRVVGERLFELAKRVIYGLPGEEAPRAVSKRVSGSMVTLITDQPLLSRDGKEPALLELAGADGKFVPARAMLEGPFLHLTAAGVEHPLHARYAWTDYGTVNLFGGNGLPLEPFCF